MKMHQQVVSLPPALPLTINACLWARMEAYQDDNLCRRFADSHGISQDKAQLVFFETKRFLFVAIVTQTPCSPSKLVDEMWHEFIIHTSNYRFFCEDFNDGQFIDHTPSEVPEIDAYIRTKALAAEIFGSLDPIAWPEASTMLVGKCSCSNKGCTCSQNGEPGTLKASRPSGTTAQ